MSFHVFNLTWNGAEAKRTGGFPGVEMVPRFMRGQKTIITGPEAKRIAAAAHEENQAAAAAGKPAPFEIELVSEPSEDGGSSFSDLMGKLKPKATKTSKSKGE